MVMINLSCISWKRAAYSHKVFENYAFEMSLQKRPVCIFYDVSLHGRR